MPATMVVVESEKKMLYFSGNGNNLNMKSCRAAKHSRLQSGKQSLHFATNGSGLEIFIFGYGRIYVALASARASVHEIPRGA